jgi:hypothetical protein
MRWFTALPLLAAPALLYALFALPIGADGMRAALASQAFAIHLPSSAEWVVTRGHLFIIFAVLCLVIEELKATRPTRSAMIDSSLSVLLFILCLVVFLLVPGFGTSEFFLVLLMCVLDFMAGMVVMLVASRRTVGIEDDS